MRSSSDGSLRALCLPVSIQYVQKIAPAIPSLPIAYAPVRAERENGLRKREQDVVTRIGATGGGAFEQAGIARRMSRSQRQKITHPGKRAHNDVLGLRHRQLPPRSPGAIER